MGGIFAPAQTAFAFVFKLSFRSEAKESASSFDFAFTLSS